MNKTELVSVVSEKTEFSKKESAQIVDALFASIEEALAKGEKVQLIGFGTFEFVNALLGRAATRKLALKSKSLQARFQPSSQARP